ncbi:MAG: hypothetical protein V7K25_22815 [Nostoc sp.]|uniref:hypothetical protein n=1 Tax=Nostoc sp. TaxID=1180 RepID=UPI002FFB3D02
MDASPNFLGDRYFVVLKNCKAIAVMRFCLPKKTLYLLSIPGMRESIKEGLATPSQECDGELDW